jgi:hypothetical protein
MVTGFVQRRVACFGGGSSAAGKALDQSSQLGQRQCANWFGGDAKCTGKMLDQSSQLGHWQCANC